MSHLVEQGFLKIASVSEVPQGRMKTVRAGDKEILLANVEGGFYAIANRCSHMGGDLSKGKLDGRVVTCPLHGSRFDVTTGKAVQGPKILFVRLSTKDLERYEVKAEGNDVLLKL